MQGDIIQEDIILSPIKLSVLLGLIQDCIKAELKSHVPAESFTEEFIDEKTAAKFLMVSKATMVNWRRDQVIPFHRLGSRIRYKKSELIKASETKRKYKKA